MCVFCLSTNKSSVWCFANNIYYWMFLFYFGQDLFLFPLFLLFDFCNSIFCLSCCFIHNCLVLSPRLISKIQSCFQMRQNLLAPTSVSGSVSQRVSNVFRFRRSLSHLPSLQACFFSRNFFLLPILCQIRNLQFHKNQETL